MGDKMVLWSVDLWLPGGDVMLQLYFDDLKKAHDYYTSHSYYAESPERILMDKDKADGLLWLTKDYLENYPS